MASHHSERIIGTYTQGLSGPLFVCVGAMHGNEKSGVKAIDLMVKMLEVEPITNGEFKFYGAFLGMIGNLEAYKRGLRFINKDLNRLWTKENIQAIKQKKVSEFSDEEKEMVEFLSVIFTAIAEFKPNQIILLDLHTTSAQGGIFSIVPEDSEAIKYALGLKAPVVLGMLEGLVGTTLHYFVTENFEIKTTSICFEAGQHDDPLSINRSIAAITNCLRFVHSVNDHDVESIHTKILENFSEGLPKLSRLIYRKPVVADDEFIMLPGFKNFDQIQKNQIVAKDKNGDVIIPKDGYILMPLYQKQGEDGFFVVEDTVLSKD